MLAISGLVMAFGKFFLLPLIGGTLFGWLTYALKTAHNFVGPLFAVSLVIVFLTFVRDNMPRRGDLTWLRQGGGMFGGKEAPSHRFNAGEKLIFWVGVLVLGVLVVGSGLVLDKVIPGLAYLRGDMQVAHMVHAVATMLMMADVPGAHLHRHHRHAGRLRAMRDGLRRRRLGAASTTRYWYEDIKAGKIPASARPSRRRAACAQPARLNAPTRRSAHASFMPAALLCRRRAAAPARVAKLPPRQRRSQGQGRRGRGQDRLDHKVGVYQLCKAMDRVADELSQADAKRRGKDAAPRATPPPAPTPARSPPRPRREAARSLGRAFAAGHGDVAAEHNATSAQLTGVKK